MAQAGLRIEWQNGALALRGGSARDRLRVAARLRSVGGNAVRARRDGYVIAAGSARLLIELLADATFAWDAEARRRVELERDRLERQLAVTASLQTGGFTAGADLDALALGVRLDAHQREAAAAIAAPGSAGLALFDEQGTGKTISALAGFALLRARGEADKVLVVAPKSVVGAWGEEATRVLGADARVVIASGSMRARRRAMRSEHDVLILNYEVAVADELLLRVLLGRNRRYLLVLDESYFAKNPDRLRSRAVARLRTRAVRAVVLSGTPAPNSAWDIVNQVNLADGGIAFGFVAQPGDRAEARRRVVAGLERSAHLRRLKVDVLPNLPTQQFGATLLPMEPKQRAMYRRAASELALELRSITDDAFSRNLSTYIARRTTLLQICSHPGGIDPLYDEVPGKMLGLDRLLATLVVERGEKVVVWSWFRRSVEAIAMRYAGYGVARIDGSVTSALARTDSIRRFQSDPETRVFVGNPGAAGAGITLTAAATAIYESMSNQAAHYLQSIDRIHRRGQQRAVRHVVLLCEGTIEEVEYERLLSKQRDARDLLRDAYREPPTRVGFLADLEKSLLDGPAG